MRKHYPTDDEILNGIMQAILNVNAKLEKVLDAVISLSKMYTAQCDVNQDQDKLNRLHLDMVHQINERLVLLEEKK